MNGGGVVTGNVGVGVTATDDEEGVGASDDAAVTNGKD